MKRFTFCMVALAASALAGTAWAEQDKADQPLRLELNLVDGSRVIGVPGIEAVPVETSYAKVNVPLKQLIAIKMGEDHETASVDLQNGDKLKGVINLGPIKLETVFGKVSVGIEHIRELRVVLAGGTLPSGEGTKEGLIAWYNFDDGTANDTSGYGNHGIVHGAKPAPDRGNRGDRAMSFDGKSSWIEVPSSHLYNALTEISIALWVCPVDDQRGERGAYSLISKQPSGSLSQQHSPPTSNHGGLFDLDLNISDGLGQLFFGSQVSSGMCTEGHIARMKPLPLGQWHHLAITAAKAENRLRVYVDGKKVDDVVCSNQIQVGHILSQPNNEPLRIGKRKDSDFIKNYFRGSMDDIRIYNRVLTEDEIERVYGARK